MGNKKIKIIIILLIVIFSIVMMYLLITKNIIKSSDILSIKSEKQLEAIYKGNSNEKPNLLVNILSMPFSVFSDSWRYRKDYSYGDITNQTNGNNHLEVDSATSSSSSSSEGSKDYSTTNIQVENVDEADITKTDGKYIYSISENNVIITDVKNPSDIKIVAKIVISNAIPEDLILYNNKLVVISSENLTSSSYYNNNANTTVNIYDTSDIQNPKLIKNYKLFEPYYTSRRINNKLYIISSGKLRKENDKIVTYYKENGEIVDLGLKNIKYLKDVKTNRQTLISMINLENPTGKVFVNSYLMDISNAYISENNIYLLDYRYEYSNNTPPISTLFGLKGAIGPFTYEYENNMKNKSGYKTKIYKFNILNDGTIKYDTKTKTDGRTINQFSIDEYNENLRVALYDNNGSRIVVFNKNLKEIGRSSNMAKGEQMYSSRFIGNKAYLVTYKTTDPLFVVDISNPSNIQILGELKIPGYSTYLHPYDENHIIGIGMQTEEKINKNSSGKVISTTSTIIGMKMALFDISNVNNPIEISNTIIGDRRATSAILTNHKALLFSKEKELIAIPVNNYSQDFSINDSSNSYDSIIKSYTKYNKQYISEGYFVYNINLKDGFKLKGVINHDNTKSKYSYSYTSKLLRGLYIDNNLYTISESAIKVNRLDNLELVSQLKIN